MENMIEFIMQESDLKDRLSGETSSATSADDESLLNLIDHISSKQNNLLDLVILLEKYHTKGNVEQRSKSISIIGTIITEVVDLGLDSKAGVGLSRFFVGKLRDVHSVLPSIKAIHGLLKHHSEIIKKGQRTGDQCLTILLDGLSPASINITSYNYKVRMAAFKCFETILLKYQEFFELQDTIDKSQANGTNVNDQVFIPYSNLISAILAAIDSEKDPRNLGVSFELTRLILSIFGNDERYYNTIEPFLEQIFENTSLYYPIEFEPPKNDKFRITPKELKDGLNKCFIASPLLASLAFPFILDKLTSANIVAKKESLMTLKLMIEELPIQKVREFCEIIWNHLQNEAFNSFEEAVQSLGIDTIAQLGAMLNYSKDKFRILQYDSISEKIISAILQRCSAEIERDPDTLTGILASNILCAIMKKSYSLGYLIIDNFLINYGIFSVNSIKIINQ